MPKVLVVDDDPSMLEWLELHLTARQHQVRPCGSATEALDAIEGETPDVMLVDVRMDGIDGLTLCDRLAANRPDIPVIVITAYGNMDTAVAAIRANAFDFVTKPVDLATLSAAIERAVRHRRSVDEVKRLEQQTLPPACFDELLGTSTAMTHLSGLLRQIADLDSSVLITGESGTGKELVARALHRNSRRAEGPFVAINCAAVPENLLEAELFGHVKGAFTDARNHRAGLFAIANKGTIFLDEIGDVPSRMQPKLLRALQERRIRPVGGNDEIACDVRVLAATNRDLNAAVEQGLFRADLFYRINVLNVEVPPLRARGADVLICAQHFIEQFARQTSKQVTGFSLQAAERLLAYAWPGNVRELQNSMERAVALTRFEKITVEDLPDPVRSYRSVSGPIESAQDGELLSLEEIERRHILRVLAATGGNKTQAAHILGVDRRTLHRKFGRNGSDRPDDQQS